MRPEGSVSQDGALELATSAPATRATGVFRTVVGLIFSNVAAIAMGLATNVLVARTLGPQGRGELSTFSSLASFGALILGFGVSQASQVIASERPNRTRKLLSVDLGTALAAGSLVALACLCFQVNEYFGLKGAKWGMLLSGMVGVLIAQGTVGAIATGVGRYRLFNLFTILLSFGLMLSATSVLVVGRKAADVVAAGNLAVYLFAAVALCVLVYAKTSRDPEPLSYDELKTAGGLGGRAGVFQLLWLSMSKIDLVIFSSIGQLYDVGIYALAVTLAEFAAIVGHHVNTVMRIDGAAGRADDRLLGLSCRLAALAGFAFVFGISLLGRPFVVLVFGGEFAPAWPIAIISSFGAACLGCVSPLIGRIQGEWKYPSGLLVVLLLAVLVEVAFSILLIPTRSYWGAAVARVIAYLTLSLGALLYSARRVALPLRDMLPRRSDITWIFQRLIRKSTPS